MPSIETVAGIGRGIMFTNEGLIGLNPERPAAMVQPVKRPLDIIGNGTYVRHSTAPHGSSLQARNITSTLNEFWSQGILWRAIDQRKPNTGEWFIEMGLYMPHFASELGIASLQPMPSGVGLNRLIIEPIDTADNHMKTNPEVETMLDLTKKAGRLGKEAITFR